jgi:hypothetical protein
LYKTITINELDDVIHSGVIEDKIITLDVKDGTQTKPLTLRKIIFYCKLPLFSTIQK